jgi:hypothetical protein
MSLVRVVTWVRKPLVSLVVVMLVVLLGMVGSYEFGLRLASWESAPALEPPSPIAATRLGALADSPSATVLAPLPALRGAKPKPTRKLAAGTVDKSRRSPVSKAEGHGLRGEGTSDAESRWQAPISTHTDTQTGSTPTKTSQKVLSPTETQKVPSPTETAPSQDSTNGSAAK